MLHDTFLVSCVLVYSCIFISSQGSDLLKTALRDNSERVVTSAQQILLPSFAVWAHELGKLEHNLLHTILRDLEELVKAIPLYLSRFCSANTVSENTAADLLSLNCGNLHQQEPKKY